MQPDFNSILELAKLIYIWTAVGVGVSVATLIILVVYILFPKK
jgi:heme exporter protein D